MPEKWRAWVRVCRALTSKIDSGGHCGFTCLQFFFRKYDVFSLSAFAHTKMKAARSSYDCGDVSVATARSVRSKNCCKKARKWDRVNYGAFLVSKLKTAYQTCYADMLFEYSIL